MSDMTKNSLLNSVESFHGIEKLIAIMRALRDPKGGCPWDLKQTYDSIITYTIEEVYEVVEAIETRDFESLKEELGDLLLQIVFYAQIATEEKRFDFNDIAEAICNKLTYRHPHVFADEKYENEEAFNQAWENKKELERKEKAEKNKTPNDNASDGQQSLLDDIPKALPELKRAYKIQKRVAKVGFDWNRIEQVWDKVNEECEEVKQAASENNQQGLEEEIGDLLFTVVNLSRHYKVDADMALRKANQKFEKRFKLVEKLAEQPLNQLDLDVMEQFWEQAKVNLN